MKKILIAFAAVAALTVSLQARTWTSADGSKTFEGTLRSYDSGKGTVTVFMSTGRLMTFPQDKLSEDDIKFLQEWEAEKNKPDPAEAAASSVVGKKVTKAKLHRLEGKRYEKAELTKAPEYYILYYSASW
jgi:hypothetical protein